jgi:endonuclease/exonuclease/phosphatase family metal-dependent hydrolase
VGPTPPPHKKHNVTKQTQLPRKDRNNGFISRNCKLLTNMDADVKIATWNVKTMLQAGKMNEIADEMMKYKLEIIALQEVRWQGRGRIDKKEFSMLYSGTEQRSGLYGTGFMIQNKVRKCLMEFEPINERICRIRLKGKFRNISLLSVHAPTEERSDEEKESFYERLEETYGKIPKYDMKIILGDFNAKIGKEECIKEVAGRFTLHKETSKNGWYLVDYVTRNGMKIRSTQFDHKKIHLGTWKVPGSELVNQIDHVLVNARYASSIYDVRSYRGPNCDSDHYLVGIKVRHRLSRVRRENIRTQKWNIEALKEESMKKTYQTTLNNELQKRQEGETPDEEWANITEAIKKTLEIAVGEKQTRRSDWFDQECREAIREKNKARDGMIQRGTRSTYAEYKEKRRIANKMCRKKKRENMKLKMEEIEKYKNASEIRKFYNAVKVMNRGYQPRMEGCRARDGTAVYSEMEGLKVWTEHFSELLNKEEDSVYNQEGIEEEMIEEPTREEICNEMAKLKNNKAPGEDGIAAEMIKKAGEGLEERIVRLVKQVWSEESMPSAWNVGVICPIFKKGDRMDCRNYRGVTLLSVVYKIFSGVLRARLSKYAERMIGEYQSGFREGRGTIDQVFTIRQIMEKFYEHDIDLHFLFIDFQQAFDSVKRAKMYQVLEEFGVPRKIIRLVKMTMDGTRARVKITGRMGESFTFNTGVKQGDSLSAVLFIITLHRVFKEMGDRRTIFNGLKQILAYADDVAVVARNVAVLKETFREIERVAETLGLMVNIGKTKYMVMSTSPIRRIPKYLQIGSMRIGGVSTFQYLGATISSDNSMRAAIQERIKAGNRAYGANLKLIRSRVVSRGTKMEIYRTLIRPVATYACETWTLTDGDANRLLVFERRILRRIFGPVGENGGWRIRSNRELEELVGNANIVRFVKSQRLRWVGHVERMDDTRMARKIMREKLYCRRRKGRPRNRWMDGVEADLTAMNVRGWRGKARDREEWRGIVGEAKAHIGL